jgi:TolB-like protein/Tfp pilus assembly protein PilF
MQSDSRQNSRGRRLESWKEIATYLGRDVRTVQRWEHQEGLPVHRHQHKSASSPYGYTAELDAWRHGRQRAYPTARHGNIALFGFGVLHFGIAAAVIGAIVLATVLWMPFTTSSRSATAVTPIRSIAVLPLANFSNEPQQEYFADGMTEALTARLSTFGGVRVISRTSVMRFKNTQRPITEIAKTLGVDAIIEGSVTRSDDRVRITAKLIHGASDTNIWSGTYEREVNDVLPLQDDVARAIAQQVRANLTRGSTGPELTRAVDPDAYESYLKGRFLLNKETLEATRESVHLFDAAIAKDPTFAPAYAGLGRAYNTMGTIFIGGTRPSETQPKALAAAAKVLELDSALPDGHALTAYVFLRQWRWVEAEGAYRRAVELDPNDSQAIYGLANLLVCLGRFDEAVALGRRARDLDPLSTWVRDFGSILYLARRYDEAIRELRMVDRMSPGNAWTLWYLGYALLASSQIDAAIGVLERSMANQNPGPRGTLAFAYARAGRSLDARRILNGLISDSRTKYVPPAVFVEAYIGLADFDSAFRSLEQAYAERSNSMRILKIDPVLDPLRGDPRFKDLVHRVGLN